MRMRTFVMLVTAALLVALSAFGQQRVRFDVPFEFSVGNAVMPAGQYDVTVAAGTMRTVITCVDCKAGALLLPVPGNEDSEPATTGKLVFNRYGGSYFLSAIWAPGASVGAALPMSKSEKERALKALPHAAPQLDAPQLSASRVVIRARG